MGALQWIKSYRQLDIHCPLSSSQLILLIVLIISAIILLATFFNAPFAMPQSFFIMQQQQQKSDGCECTYNKTIYNFCYHLPWNSVLHGIPFNCSNAHHLEKLNLLEGGTTNGLRYFVNPEVDELPGVVMVTAFSDNHFEEGLEMLASVRRFWPQQLVIFYDIGLSSAKILFMQNLCNVIYRPFNFSSYPKYVRELTQYRWKPLIIAEVLKEYGAMWWLDSSVRFTSNNVEQLYDQYNCKRRQNTIWNNFGGWNPEEKDDNCSKTDFLFPSTAGHSIFAATNPDVYRYLPSKTEKLKEVEMLGATFMFFVRTRDVVNILKWAVACALEKECMGFGKDGKTFNLFCKFAKDDRYKTYAQCHRFDQSVFNILMANQYDFDFNNYFSNGMTFSKINRAATRSVTADMLTCGSHNRSDKMTSS